MSDRWVPLIGLVMAAAMPLSCSAPPRTPERAGPDARVSRLPEAANGDRWPSEELRFIVARPTYDQSPQGTDKSIDPRTTLAIVDPGRATWVMDARLDDESGLQLTSMLEQLVALDTLEPNATASARPIRVSLKMQPEGDQDRVIVNGGHWKVRQVRTPTDSTPQAMITLALVDGRGTLAGEASMSLLAARDLLVRLDGGVRATRR
ncbi:MAG: hypothetical protein MK116_04270 [Phycisphaerales bacterium]|nr:hypothetical protein [Phycisphaerales bacterium]